MSVNGSQVAHLLDKKPPLPLACPFCNGEAAPMHSDPPEGSGGSRLFGIQCTACGVLSPPGQSHDEALALWNRRAEASPASLAKPDTPAETCAVAAQLVELARVLYAGTAPPANAVVVVMNVMAGPLQSAVGMMVSNNLGSRQASEICAVAARQLALQAIEPKTPGGIIVPNQA